VTCRAELARWLTERCTCPFGEARHARDALIAVVYDRCCAHAGGGPSEHLLAAKYIAVTLLADDAHDRPPDLEGMVRYLTTGQVDDGELVRCFSALVEELMAQGHDPTRFLRAVQDTITHRLREREVDARTITWDEHWEIRRHTIAVAPYVWCRSTTRDLGWSETIEDALRESGVLVLASEAVARASDLASFPRESLPTPSLDRPLSLNSVLHYARDLGDLDSRHHGPRRLPHDHRPSADHPAHPVPGPHRPRRRTVPGDPHGHRERQPRRAPPDDRRPLPRVGPLPGRPAHRPDHHEGNPTMTRDLEDKVLLITGSGLGPGYRPERVTDGPASLPTARLNAPPRINWPRRLISPSQSPASGRSRSSTVHRRESGPPQRFAPAHREI
jgi:hypothetical protein